MSEQRRFNPRDHLTTIKGRGGSSEYLPVAARLLWLRTEHPDAHTMTDLVSLDEHEAIVKATISIPDGGTSTGFGSVRQKEFPTAYLEKAETKALGRALAALGYGTQFAGEELSVTIVDAPVERASTDQLAEIKALIEGELGWPLGMGVTLANDRYGVAKIGLLNTHQAAEFAETLRRLLGTRQPAGAEADHDH